MIEMMTFDLHSHSPPQAMQKPGFGFGTGMGGFGREHVSVSTWFICNRRILSGAQKPATGGFGGGFGQQTKFGAAPAAGGYGGGGLHGQCCCRPMSHGTFQALAGACSNRAASKPVYSFVHSCHTLSHTSTASTGFGTPQKPAGFGFGGRLSTPRDIS